MDKVKKTAIIEKFAREKINQLTGHMAANRHDYHTQRGLIKLVGKRRRLLAYLMREDVQRYRDLIRQLGLRK